MAIFAGEKVMIATITGWTRITSREPVVIPDATGDGIAETIWTEVPAWQDPKTGMVFLDGEAHELLDEVKAQHLGVLAPHQTKKRRAIERGELIV